MEFAAPQMFSPTVTKVGTDIEVSTALVPDATHGVMFETVVFGLDQKGTPVGRALTWSVAKEDHARAVGGLAANCCQDCKTQLFTSLAGVAEEGGVLHLACLADRKAKEVR